MIRSAYTVLIQQIFENHGVRYRTEIPTDFGGRFDFGIFKLESEKEEIICLIEFDGTQHETVQNWLFSERLQEMDKLKDSWAEENKIPLIRLPESEFQSVVKLTQFIKDELLPTLPDEAFYPGNSKPQFIWSGLRNRSVNISDLVKEEYSIKVIAELMGYSESYVGTRIKNSHWFTNESGKSNFKTAPYSINLEDVISGLVRLGFLKDFNGDKISDVDKSMITELIEKINHDKNKDSETLLVIQWDADFVPESMDTTGINKVIIKRNPNFRDAVLIAMKDEIEKIIFWGDTPEDLRELIDHSIIKEKLVEVLK